MANEPMIGEYSVREVFALLEENTGTPEFRMENITQRVKEAEDIRKGRVCLIVEKQDT